MRAMVSSSKHPPKPRVTIEVEADWLDHARPGSGGHRRPAVPPPLPAEAPVPPPLAANSARHNTIPVEAQWLEVTELDAKLRASLAPLPPPDDRPRARMSSPIPREDPDDEPPAARAAEAEETRPARRAKVAPGARAAKTGAKKTAKKASNKR